VLVLPPLLLATGDPDSNLVNARRDNDGGNAFVDRYNGNKGLGCLKIGLTLVPEVSIYYLFLSI
jgi:hypothetical protein